MGRRKQRIRRKRQRREAQEELARREGRIRAEAIGRDYEPWRSIGDLPAGLQITALIGVAAAGLTVLLLSEPSPLVVRSLCWATAFLAGVLTWFTARRRMSVRLKTLYAIGLAIWAGVASLLF